MHTVDSTPFRLWAVERFNSMADDPDWRADNPAEVPQALRITYALNHNEPISPKDAERVMEEIVDFEEVLKDLGSEWIGAKRFLVDARLVSEVNTDNVVCTGKPYWFRYRGKKYA